MVWAGDQLLWELRRASESAGEESSNAGSYGTVSYTHAGGIDRPLVITKDGTSILPHQNWRGQFSSGTRPADGSRSDCQAGVVANCVQIAWPGHRTTAWHHAVKEPDIRTWWGGLVDGMRDASGQMYMRNRYYDPATGQFTQPDPIGIAGGLNSYGFAAGDPVSFSDPYGLCAQSDTVPAIQQCTVAQDKAAAHRALIARETTDAAVPWSSDPTLAVVGGGPIGRGMGLLAGASRSLAARGIAMAARRAGPGALVRIQAIGQIVGRLGLNQRGTGDLITTAMGRLGYEVGEDVMIGQTRYLVSKTADRATAHAIAIAPDGSVSNASLRNLKGGGYELVQ